MPEISSQFHYQDAAVAIQNILQNLAGIVVGAIVDIKNAETGKQEDRWLPPACDGIRQDFLFVENGNNQVYPKGIDCDSDKGGIEGCIVIGNSLRIFSHVSITENRSLARVSYLT